MGIPWNMWNKYGGEGYNYVITNDHICTNYRIHNGLWSFSRDKCTYCDRRFNKRDHDELEDGIPCCYGEVNV